MSALSCPLPDPFAEADLAYEKITSFLCGEAKQLRHSDLERQLGEMGQDLLRKLMQAHLEMRQPGEAQEPVRDAAGTTLKPRPVHTRSLETIFGTVEVSRAGYGAEGKPSLHPLDAALNLPEEKYSLEVRRRVAIEASRASFDEGVETLEKLTGAHVPKRQFEQLTISAAQDFEAFYAERQKRACADAASGSILVLTVDGNETQIHLLERLAEERNLSVPIVVDFIHVAQYLWEAAKALFPGDEQRQDRWVREHMLEILRGKTSTVEAGMRRSATFRKLSDAERKPVDDCAHDLHKYAPYFHYEEALAIGAPIATGVIEGACRYLVEDRMNRTGARWSLTGAEAVLRLRALRASGDFDQYWEFHEQQIYLARSSKTEPSVALKIVKKQRES